jgi:hypothetical protein
MIGSDESLLPGLSMPSLTTSNQSESVSDFPAVPSTTSTKTTPESSNPFIVSPAPSLYEHSPVNKEAALQLPATSIHSTDSIAQMLEYMRACNSQDAPPPPTTTSSSSYSLSNHSDVQHDDFKGEQQRDSRKKERSTSRNTRQRKQLSPAQKLSRSYSHGSDNGLRPGISSLQHRARQRSKTNTLLPPQPIAEDEESDSKPLHIDTDSAIQAVGPSGVKRQASTGVNSKQRQPASAGSELWLATESPSSAAAPPWSVQSEASNSQSNLQKGNADSLTLSEFLKRPEGEMWFQHFQKQYPSRAAQPDFASASAPYAVQQPPQALPQQQQAPTLPSLAPLTPSILAYLPPPTDVASMLGMQQAPNQALVQAFQTAFVLGMQQLGMAGQFQQPVTVPPPAPVTQQPYPFSWTPQQPAQQHHQHQQQSQPLPSKVAAQQQQLPALTHTAESGDASSVLQNLLHDINQHRPDKQEFSVDEFLAFVANTVESTGDDTGQHQERQGDEKKVKEGSSSSGRKLRKTSDNVSEVVQPAAAAEKKKSNNSRRRTISISGQLSGTYLDDVAEDVNKSEPQAYHHKSDKASRAGLQSESLYHQSVVDDRDEEDDEDEEGEEEDRGSEESQHRREAPSTASQNSKATQKEKEAHKLAERRRRRRESHNAVERRRRDHINERIAELASLLPESMLLDAVAASTSGGTMPHIDLSLFTRPKQTVDPTSSLDLESIEGAASGSHRDFERKANALEPVHSSSETLALAQSKPNKGIILSKIVEYIKHLHEFCSVLRVKNSELMEELDRNKALVLMEPALSYETTLTEDSTMINATPPANLTE